MATYPTPPFGGKRNAGAKALESMRKKQKKRMPTDVQPKSKQPRTSGAMSKGIKPKIAAPTAIKRIRKTY
jgi:hypothetical protein